MDFALSALANCFRRNWVFNQSVCALESLALLHYRSICESEIGLTCEVRYALYALLGQQWSRAGPRTFVFDTAVLPCQAELPILSACQATGYGEASSVQGRRGVLRLIVRYQEGVSNP